MSTHLETRDSTINRMACAAALSLPLLACAADELPAQGVRLQVHVAFGAPAVRSADASTIDNCAVGFTTAGVPQRLADAGVLVLWVPPGCAPGSACADAAAGYLASDREGYSAIP